MTDRIRYAHLPAPQSRMSNKPGLVVELLRRDPNTELSARFSTAKPLGQTTRSHGAVPLQIYVTCWVSDPKSEPIEPVSLSARQ